MGKEAGRLSSGNEQLQAEQQEVLGALVQAGKWEDITPQMFPTVLKPTVELAKDQAFDVRISYIGNQMNQLSGIAGLYSDNEKIEDIINGRISELKEELAGILTSRFPDTKPVKVIKNEAATVLLDRDVNAAIQFFVSQGEVEALTAETIPALKHLRPETLIELQIDALLSRLARYKEWKSVEIDGEKHGYQAPGEKPQKSSLDRLADKQIEETVAQIAALSEKRLAILK